MQNEHEHDAELGLKEKLLLPVKMAQGDDGKDYQVCPAEIECLKVRRMISALLKVLDNEAFSKYKAMKQVENASLSARRKAYLFAFNRVLELCYTIPGL